jgi:mycofactocin glycosyltransferase
MTVRHNLGTSRAKRSAGPDVRRQEAGTLALPVAADPTPVPAWQPPVSIVIPCKRSEATIRATVAALLAQDYPNLREVILVGDVGDSTWEPLADIANPRLTILEQEQTAGRRDPNVKRDKGIRKSSGDVIALVDSDIVMDPDWLTKAVWMLIAQGGGLVAGGMRSIHDTFWGRFVDRNVLAAKTPRLDRPYQVTAANFGTRGFKPPITANAVFTRTLYDACPLDTKWAHGYEDYEWFWRLAKLRYKILFSGELTAAHHHRSSFRGLVKEYSRAAHGCAHYMNRHPDSPLSRKRTKQALLLPLATAVGLAGVVAAITMGHGTLAAVVALVAALALTGREAMRSRSIEAGAYSVLGLALGLVFTTSLVTSLGRVILKEDDMPDTLPVSHEMQHRRSSLPRRIAGALPTTRHTFEYHSATKSRQR